MTLDDAQRAAIQAGGHRDCSEATVVALVPLKAAR